MAMREQEAIAGGEAQGFGDAFDDEPSVAGLDGITLDAVMVAELDGGASANVKAAGDVGVGLQEREYVGERVEFICQRIVHVCLPVGRLRRYYGFPSIDRTPFEDYFADSEAAEAALQEMQSCVFLLRVRQDLLDRVLFLS
jgi:hypothetical protein